MCGYLKLLHMLLLHDLDESGFWGEEFELFADSEKFTFTVDERTALISLKDNTDKPFIMISRQFLHDRAEVIGEEIVLTPDFKYKSCLEMYSRLLIHDLWIMQDEYKDGRQAIEVDQDTGFMILPSHEDGSDDGSESDEE
ncbi:hypothetical protein JX266_013471 [Neoarthrinium moseri]|nr:hypothetical protein JX266_013471 [Neoarthrinium moseri]